MDSSWYVQVCSVLCEIVSGRRNRGIHEKLTLVMNIGS
jgi:hypothetical protein